MLGLWLPDGQVDVDDDWPVELLAPDVRVPALHDGGVDEARLLPAHPAAQGLAVATGRVWVGGVAAQAEGATAGLGSNGAVIVA